MQIPKEVFNSNNSNVLIPVANDPKQLADIVWTRLTNSSFFQLITLRKQFLLRDLFRQEVGMMNYPIDVSLEFNTSKYDPILDYANGYYSDESHTIVLNAKLFSKHYCEDIGVSIYAVLKHELRHAMQHYMIYHLEKFPENQSDIFLYGIILSGKDYCSTFCQKEPVRINLLMDRISENNALSVMFYALNITEREAHEIQYQLCPPKHNILSDSYEFARKRYGKTLTDKDIDDLMDQSFINIFSNAMPEGNYEKRNQLASAMYDLVYAGRAMYEKDFSLIEDGSLLLHKKKILAEYGYNMPNEEPINDLMFSSEARYTRDFVKDLSIEKQRVNPRFLLTVMRKDESIINDIKDKEAFKYEVLKFADESHEFAYGCFYRAFPECSSQYLDHYNNIEEEIEL